MELPIKKAVFDPNDPTMGLKMISLVNDPAIQVNWIKFSADKEIKLAIQNEEQRIIFTPVLIPDQLIERNMNGERFHLTFDADTIEAIAIRWMKDNLSSKVDTEHTGQLIPGVTFFESTITNKDRFTLAKGFESLPVRTWYLTGKVDSDETWAKIKNGEVKGVSIDGIFGIQATKMAEISDEDLTAILKKLYN